LEYIENFAETQTDIDVEREERRKRRMQEMRRRKKQQELIRRLFIPALILFVVLLVGAVTGVRMLIRSVSAPKIEYDGMVSMTNSLTSSYAASAVANELEYMETATTKTVGGKSTKVLTAVADDATASYLGADVVSENGVFIDVEAERIMAQKGAYERISPASMTKILTVLVAAEHITDLDDTFEITLEITDYSFSNGCSNTGFSVGEVVTVRDLFYGTILPSGADAALGLAIYTAGSHEAFVELMNEKLKELGLSETSHFTNCVGLYDEDHYSTVYDIAVMLKAAADNSFCREVLSARTYTTSETEQHPEGITVSNWFLRRIEDKDTNGELLCAKTGYVVQSGNCSASLSVGSDGKEYICVTAHSTSSWRCIYDHVAMYQQFMPTETS
jgi:D-alanyl-D-alanine carboxypeptidase (penicillin-binding protein 5/6)